VNQLREEALDGSTINPDLLSPRCCATARIRTRARACARNNQDMLRFLETRRPPVPVDCRAVPTLW
jgi:hypothetical protein